MTTRTHHVFFSYARADNDEANNHFVTRFHDLLCKEHQAVTGRELKTFFDTEAIDSGEHWKTRLGQGLRDSRLFVAFLSDNYLKSEVCQWEWEHYLLTEHTAARGEDGVVLYRHLLGCRKRVTELHQDKKSCSAQKSRVSIRALSLGAFLSSKA